MKNLLAGLIQLSIHSFIQQILTYYCVPQTGNTALREGGKNPLVEGTF
jgi:hypothetical protein